MQRIAFFLFSAILVVPVFAVVVPCSISSEGVWLEPPPFGSRQGAFLRVGTKVQPGATFGDVTVSMAGKTINVALPVTPVYSNVAPACDVRMIPLPAPVDPDVWYDVNIAYGNGKTRDESVAYDRDPPQIEIIPANPTAGDEIAIVVSGRTGNLSTPDPARVRIDGNDIYVDIDVFYSGLTLVGAYVVPEALPPLKSGTYNVLVNVHVGAAGGVLYHTRAGTRFTIGAEPRRRASK